MRPWEAIKIGICINGLHWEGSYQSVLDGSLSLTFFEVLSFAVFNGHNGAFL